MPIARCTLSALAVLSVLLAAPGVRAGENGTLSFVLENDLFYDADRHYTNGVRATWLSPRRERSSLAVRAARLFPLFPLSGAVRTEYAVGQNMYTPTDITLANPPLDDRPYAGWTYASVGLVAETGRRLDQLSLSLGIVGPASLADETQRIVHEITGADTPRGWHTQLRNEPAVLLAYQRSWRGYVSDTFHGLGVDVTPHLGVALGNVFTYANGGLTVRFGERLPLDYGPPRIQPSLPGSGFFIPSGGFSWYLFAGVEGRAVARNIFLDGNTFRDSRSVDRKVLVGDLQYGLAVMWDGVRLAYTHVMRTKEFDGQDTPTDFGAFSVSVAF
ncbi:lipid A deacylase LpxR family protein [Futiania mangrovi]|uniref:Lipid A deacylase LpxR family protein n=1 Tax=Futiania mangrovi TaxID=2959716 RepID=A0A9J6P803_9PROT|nr:lipid A deacylase LpxR family protein [Futiania mangrovii]MCP1335556.1 lipid A deacylase LpxR family protein [Futiania mangrovii]